MLPTRLVPAALSSSHSFPEKTHRLQDAGRPWQELSMSPSIPGTSPPGTQHPGQKAPTSAPRQFVSYRTLPSIQLPANEHQPGPAPATRAAISPAVCLRGAIALLPSSAYISQAVVFRLQSHIALFAREVPLGARKLLQRAKLPRARDAQHKGLSGGFCTKEAPSQALLLTMDKSQQLTGRKSHVDFHTHKPQDEVCGGEHFAGTH